MKFQGIFSAVISAALVVVVPLLFLSEWNAAETGAREVHAERVISLSPSLTRQVIDLGAGNLLVGVTSYCPQPDKKSAVVGTIIQPSIETIALLRPDLVIASEEDNAVQHLDRLKALGIRTVSFLKNRDFEAICANYLALGRLLGMERTAEDKIEKYRRERDRLKAGADRCPVAFIISHRPLIAASGDSYISRIIADAGGRNVVGRIGIAYPIVSAELLIATSPRVILSIIPGAPEFFSGMYGLHGAVRAAVHSIGVDHVPYYTPADYLASIAEVRAMLAGGGACDE